MPSKPLLLWRRTIGRIARPLADLQRKTRLLVWILGVLGIAALGRQWETTVLPWLQDDWAHWLVLVLGLLLLGALLAVYGAEKELESRRHLQIKIQDLSVQFRPILNFNDGPRHNLLVVEVEIRFRNDSEKPTRAYFPQVEVLRRKGSWRWSLVVLEPVKSYFGGSMAPRGLPNQRDRWFKDKRNEIHALDDTILTFHIMWMVPDNLLGILDEKLRIRLTIDLVGAGLTVLEEDLPIIDKTAYA